jgi:hypothetical protein
VIRLGGLEDAGDDRDFATEGAEHFGRIGCAAHAAEDNAGIVRPGRGENVGIRAVAAEAGNAVGFQVRDDTGVVIHHEDLLSILLQGF